MKKYSVPFAVYLSSSFPEGKALLWWYILEDIIIQNPELILSNGNRFSCIGNDEKLKAFFEVRKVIMSLRHDRFASDLKKLFFAYDVDWRGKCEDLVMTWSDVIEISKDELCTIGGHTINHFALNRLPVKMVSDEVVWANQIIESKIGKRVDHFSYPFGGVDEVGKREFDIVKRLGFKTATTTRRGNIYLKHRKYLESLPRIMLTENFCMREVGKVRRSWLAIT